MSNKPSILIVHNYYKIPGGEDTVVANEMDMLKKSGNKVFLYSRSNSEISGFSVFGKLKLPFTAIFSIKTYREIVKMIRREKIDIVHVHNTLSLVSPAVYYAARHCKVPVVQTIHNFRLLCPGATFYRDGHICEDCVSNGLMCAVKHRCYRESLVQTLICSLSTAIHRAAGIYGKINYICLTQFNREKLLSLRQIKPETVFVKPNFVDGNDSFIPAEKRVEQMVFAGRLDMLKGVDVLLEAWRIMGKNAPKLILCGTGPMEDWCRSFVEQHNLNVVIKGFVPNKEVLKIVAESKAIILPTQWYEGFPVSIVEALSVGTPVLCSKIGNAGCVITEGVSGCKFSPDSPEELVEAIGRLAESGVLYESTKRDYIQKYTREINHGILSDIYSKVLQTKHL